VFLCKPDLLETDSIAGVSFFAASAPNDFGIADRAFVTCFRILSGENWFDWIDQVCPSFSRRVTSTSETDANKGIT
jgi:hypothetical protein